MWIARYLDLQSLAVGELRTDADEREARAQLQREGKRLLSLRREREPWSRWLAAWARPRTSSRKAADVALLCRELRALTMAGLSVVEALEALALQSRSGDRAQLIYGQLLERLRAGRPLSGALQDLGGFPVLLVASVQSSERTSNLPDALDAYLRYDELVTTLGRRVVSAALYPAIVVCLGVLIALFLLAVVMPRFAALYGQMGQDAGGVTAALLKLSAGLHAAPWAVPAGLVTLTALVGWLMATGHWRSAWSWVVAQIPALATQRRHFELARVFEAMALLVKGGFGVHESLAMCRQLTLSQAMGAAIAAAQGRIERGQSVSNAFGRASLADAVTERLLRAGERGGDFAEVLHAVSRRHGQIFETFVERATRLVEPLLLLGVALVIGSMVVMLYMPIFDIASAVR